MKLFTSATIKLAAWYLLILMAVSLLFSVIIFQVAMSEIASRLDIFIDQRALLGLEIGPSTQAVREQLDSATGNLVVSLVYINFVVLVGGGAGAYLLARRTLRPIEAAHEAQSRFVANASHQFRTPLAIMKAETELALSDKKAKKIDLTQTLKSNLEEINHLSTLSAMLLELSRSENAFGQATDRIDLVDIMSKTIEARGATNRTTIEVDDSPIIYSYEAAVREIVHILLDNALKHSPINSPILFKVIQDKQTVCLSITNSSTTTNMRQLPHVFERFYRSKKSDGYGLGLPLAKQLTKALGGTVELTSPAKKLVTTTVRLPK